MSVVPWPSQASHVEAEAPGRVAADLGLGESCEELPDLVEDAGVRGGVGARGLADGRLVDLDCLVDLSGAQDLEVGAGLGPGAVHDPREPVVERLRHERALACGRGGALHHEDLGSHRP